MTTGLHRIHLKEFDPERYADDWVDIKERRSFADRQRIDGWGVGLQGNDPTALLNFALTTFEVSVRAWTLTDEAGEPLPAAREGFLHDDFPEDLGEWLHDQIDTFHQARKRGSEDRKNSDSPSVAT